MERHVAPPELEAWLAHGPGRTGSDGETNRNGLSGPTEILLLLLLLLGIFFIRVKVQNLQKKKKKEKEMGGGSELMRRIPRIKFPQRHLKTSASATAAQETSTTRSVENISMPRSSDVPASPSDMAVGGKATLQPKRTPVSDREIEAILLGGCI